MAKRFRWLLIGLAVVAVLALVMRETSGPQVAEGSVLVVDLQGSYVDGQASPLLGMLFGRRERSLLATTSELRKAELDARIHTVLFVVRDLRVGWGRARELRAAVARLGERGKETIAVLEYEGFGSAEYYVASAAKRVVMHPASRNPFVGLAGEYVFLGGLFDKLGVKVEYERIGRYKSAVEMFAASKMSDANREMTDALLDSIYGEYVDRIAESRGLTPAEVEAAIDQGPASPEEMRSFGLVDDVAGARQVLADLGRPVVKADDYAAVAPEDVGFHPEATIAVIYGTGAVVSGDGDVSPSGERVMASTTVSDALRDATDDPDVRAIVLRLNSPGGSPLASDVIWQAVRRASESGKPVVASLSDAAASGAYYVASAADAIVTWPETLTGSIGVFVLRPSVGGLLDRLGIGVAGVTRGARADLLLSSAPLSAGARAILREDVQSVYELFLSRVAEGRGLDRDAVDAVGRGRVWTGAQALEHHLVDSLGGMPEAVDVAKQKAGLDPEAQVALVTFPPPRPLAAQIAEALGVAARSALPALPLPEGVRGLVGTLSQFGDGGPVLLPPAWLEVR